MLKPNSKIKNASCKEFNNIQFKSRLEVMCYKTLLQAGFKPDYEKIKFVLLRGFRPTVKFYTRDTKTGNLKINNKKIIDITYTPDFTFEYNGILIVIEVKGFENDVFPLKKKLFRRYMEESLEDSPSYIYFEIFNKKQLLQAIEVIKSISLNK
jgi:hypothetical protein